MQANKVYFFDLDTSITCCILGVLQYPPLNNFRTLKFFYELTQRRLFAAYSHLSLIDKQFLLDRLFTDSIYRGQCLCRHLKADEYHKTDVVFIKIGVFLLQSGDEVAFDTVHKSLISSQSPSESGTLSVVLPFNS